MATLKEAINYAKANPKDAKSEKLKQAIIMGKMDSIAQTEGIDLSAFKQKAAPLASKILPMVQPMAQKAAETARTSTPEELSTLAQGAKEDERDRADMLVNIPTSADVEKVSKQGLPKEMLEAERGKMETEYAQTQTPEGQAMAKMAGASLGGSLSDIGGGTIRSAGKAGLNVAELATEAVGSEEGSEYLEGLKTKLLENKDLQAKYTPQILNDIIGDVLTYAVPLMGISKAGKAAGTAGRLAKIGTEAGLSAGLFGATADPGERLKMAAIGGVTAPLADFAAPIIGKGLKAGKELISPSTETKVAQIVEKIAPALTKKEAQVALKEGRYIPESESMLFGKKSATATPTKKVQEVGKYIEGKIPNANKMNEADLYKAIDDEIGKIAKPVKNEMKSTLFSNEQKQAAKTKWTELKTKQSSTPEFANSKSGGKAAQKEFESFLEELTSKGKDGQWKNLDDAWDVAKRYDRTIPENVKKATSTSDTFLQLRKEMWLENRAILRDAVKDAAKNMGKEGEAAFKQMTDLYEAQNNILQSVKKGTKPKGGLLSAENLKKTAIGYGGVKLFEKTTGLNVPFL